MAWRCRGSGTLRGYPGDAWFSLTMHCRYTTALHADAVPAGREWSKAGRAPDTMQRGHPVVSRVGFDVTAHQIKMRRLMLSIQFGRWDRESLGDRLRRALDGGPPDPDRLAARLLFHFPPGHPPSRSQLAGLLAADRELAAASQSGGKGFEARIVLDTSVMQAPTGHFSTLPLPTLDHARDLGLWLGLNQRELAWFADCESRQTSVRNPKLHHYRYRWLARRSAPPRLLEIPKARLKLMQRQVLHHLLDCVPPHPAAHGFRRHRSCLSFATPHLQKPAVLHMDLEDFFPSIPAPRVGALFRRLGYPPGVARVLQGLCTHAVAPALVGAEFDALPWETRRRLQAPHLAQGAPSSPAIANLCAWRLDCRLQGLADRFELDYTRYADDLAFSGPASLLRRGPFVQALIGAIAAEEGFRINHRKTRLNTQAQSQRLAGVVVNQRPNLQRRDYDRLKATLHNCARFGPEGQNHEGRQDFRAHLAGRIAHVAWLNPDRGARLKALWARISWPD